MASASHLPRAVSFDDLESELDDEFSTSQLGENALSFVAFDALGEVYGIELTRVVEIAHSIKITRLPGTPAFISGIVSLRGLVVPVVDLQAKFGGGPGEYGPRSGIIVVEVGARTVGVRAQRVNGIVAFRPEDLTPVPNMSSKIRTELLRGLARSGDELLIALDVDRLLSEDELALVEAHVPDTAPAGAR